MSEEVLRRIVARGDRDAQRRTDQERSIKPTEYIGNGYVKQLGQSPTRSRYLSNAGLVPGELVAPLGHGQQDVIIHKKPEPFISAKEEEDEVQFIETIIFLSYSVIPEYEFNGTNVLDAFRINITGTQLDVVVFDEEIATITPFDWVSVGNPYRHLQVNDVYTTFSQVNSLSGNYSNTFTASIPYESFQGGGGVERYDWVVGRGFDGEITGVTSIDKISNNSTISYRAITLTYPTEYISVIDNHASESSSLSTTDLFVRNRNAMIQLFLFHTRSSTPPQYGGPIIITYESFASSTLSGNFLPNPRVIDQWQYSDSTGWVYWLKVQRGDDTHTAYSDQYFFGFEGRLQTLNNTKVYGKRTFIDNSVEYAEGETYEELIYTSSIITPQDFRDTPISSNLVFTFNIPFTFTVPGF